MFELNSGEWFYIFSISMQLSGAVLLIIKYWFINTEKEISSLKSKENRVEGETFKVGQCQPSENEFKKELWINRVSFVYIALGYLLSIFGEKNNYNNLFIFIWLLIISIVVISFSYFIISRLFKSYNKNENKKN